MFSSKNLFAYVLSFLVLGVVILALLGIWDLIDWTYVQRYFWKTLQSLVVLIIGALVIYVIQSIFHKPEQKNENRTQE